jgi:uncharacterized protein YcbX
MHISELFYYPIKSGAGVALTEAVLDERGIVGDREFMVVDDFGRFLTQREAPLLALVSWESPHVLTPVGRATIEAGPLRDVTVWDYAGPAIDCGDEVAVLLSDFLGRCARLVRTPPGHARRSDDGRTGVGFADGYPLLLIGQASLAELNARLPQPLPMNRFRPNVVVADSAPFAEDTWGRIRLGEVAVDVVKPCKRCAITAVDQATGERGDGEPLRTLGSFRKVKGGVIFGQNVVHEQLGTLRVGDAVSLQEDQVQRS